MKITRDITLEFTQKLKNNLYYYEIKVNEYAKIWRGWVKCSKIGSG